MLLQHKHIQLVNSLNMDLFESFPYFLIGIKIHTELNTSIC